MERGPIPPHERPWRHPSEVAADERAALRAAAPSTSTRSFALVTGTLGLLAVGALVLTLSPQRHESPVAVGASTSVAAAERPAQPSGRPAPIGVARPTLPLDEPIEQALATAVGDGRLALATLASLVEAAGLPPEVASSVPPGAAVEVRFRSGARAPGEVVGQRDDGVVLIALYESQPGLEIAPELPDGDEIVTVLATPPIAVALADVEELEVREGTAVLDSEGELIGICTVSDDATDEPTRLLEVAGLADR